MKNILITALILFLTSCGSVQYVRIPVPYLPEFTCAPIVKPELRAVNTDGITQEEREQARRYNLIAAARYIISLRNYINCLEDNMELIRKEAVRMEKALDL